MKGRYEFSSERGRFRGQGHGESLFDRARRDEVISACGADQHGPARWLIAHTNTNGAKRGRLYQRSKKGSSERAFLMRSQKPRLLQKSAAGDAKAPLQPIGPLCYPALQPLLSNWRRHRAERAHDGEHGDTEAELYGDLGSQSSGRLRRIAPAFERRGDLEPVGKGEQAHAAE